MRKRHQNENDKLQKWLNAGQKEDNLFEKKKKYNQGKKCVSCLYKDKIVDEECKVYRTVGCPQVSKNPSPQLIRAVLDVYK